MQASSPIQADRAKLKRIVNAAIDTIEERHARKKFSDLMETCRRLARNCRTTGGAFREMVRSIYIAGMRGGGLPEKEPEKANHLFLHFDPYKFRKKDVAELNRREFKTAQTKLEGFVAAANFICDTEAQMEESFVAFLDEHLKAELPVNKRWEFVGGLSFRNFRSASACNFLRQLGYEGFAKPDVWLGRIFARIFTGNEQHKYSEYEVFCIADRLAKASGRTPAEIDKVFWTLGSGIWLDKDEQNRPGERVCDTTKPKCHSCRIGNDCQFFRMSKQKTLS